MKLRDDLYREEAQGFFPLDEEERRQAAEQARKARALLAGKTATRPGRELSPEPKALADEPGFYPSEEERRANLQRLSREVCAAVDAVLELGKRQHGA